VDVVGGATRATEGCSVDAFRTDVAVLFELGERDVEIGSRSETRTHRALGITAAEHLEAAPAEPGEQDRQVGDGGIGAHSGVGGAGVGDEVVGEDDSGVDGGDPHPQPLPLAGGGGKWLGEGGEVEEAGDAGDRSHELAGPVDEWVEVPVRGEAGFDGAGEVAETYGGGLGEGEDEGGVLGEGRAEEKVGVGEGEEGADAAVVVGAEGVGDGLGVDVAAAKDGVGDGVKEAGEEAAAEKSRADDEAAQDFGLDGQADGEGGARDDLAGPADAIDHDRVAGVALEVVVEVGRPRGGVPTGDEVEDAALGGQDGETPALLVEEHGEALGGAVVRDQAGEDGNLDGSELVGATLDEGDELGAAVVWGEGGSVLGTGEGLLGGVARSPGTGDVGGGRGGGVGLELLEGLGDGGEDGTLAVAGRQDDHAEEIEGLEPVAPGTEEDAAGQGRREDGEAEEAGEIGWGLGGAGLGADEAAEPVWEDLAREGWEDGAVERDGIRPGTVRPGGIAAQDGDEAIDVGDAGLREEEGGAAILWGSVEGGLDRLDPTGIQMLKLVRGGELTDEGVDEDGRGGVGIDGHGSDLMG